jgi:hypothetical protein
MDILLGWPPNVWAARLLLLLCLAGAVVVLLALLVRLLRRAEVGATEAVQVLALERRIGSA